VNINTSFDSGGQRRGRDEIARAKALETSASPVERALIDAAAARYALTGKNDADASARAYADAMLHVAQHFPDDDDVQALTAEAEMDATPWDYWTAAGKPSNPRVPDVVARLQRVLARDPEHLQANHLLIHVLEESPHPKVRSKPPTGSRAMRSSRAPSISRICPRTPTCASATTMPQA
jgi:hypothetical protein